MKASDWSTRLQVMWTVTRLQLPAGDPEEEETVVLQHGNVKLSHLIVRQSSIRQLHVDVPGRVGHHYRKLPQYGHIQVADITADPLRA